MHHARSSVRLDSSPDLITLAELDPQALRWACPRGDWAAVEIKLGSSRIPEAEANLLKLRDERVDTERMGSPRFMAVVTGTEYGYTLPSGVHVIPLGTLSA